MEDLLFPETVNVNSFNVDGLNLKVHNDDETHWEKIQPWLIWLIYLKIYLILTATVVILLYAIYLRYANRSSVVHCAQGSTMEGKIVVITANPSGIGLEAARDLALRGARVILATKDTIKAQEVADSLEMNEQNGLIIVRKVDMSSLRAVTDFADYLLKTEKRLDVLMLTANIPGSASKEITVDDGIEVTMAANHFGHFLLVNLLLGLLKSSQPSRIVVLASSAHYLLSSLNPKDLNFKSVVYGGLRAYTQSMACNLLMTNNLAHLTEHSGITVNSMCPGMIASQPYITGNSLITKLYLLLLKVASRTDEEGAQTLIHLASSEKVAKITGSFFTDCKERGMTRLGKDHGLAKKTWERCEEIVGFLPRHDN